MVWAWTSCRVQASPCTVCCTGVGSNSIFCNVCKHWVHKKCSGAQVLDKGSWLQMYTVPANCTPLEWQTTEGSPSQTWQAAGGSFLLLPRRHVLSSWWLWTFNHNMCENCLEEVRRAATSSLFPHLSFKMRGHVYSSCMGSAMLHASETWPLTKPNLQRLQQNDRAMIRQICNVNPQDIVTTRSSKLLAQLGIEDLDLFLKERRLRWYGHVECSNGAVRTAFDIQVDGKHGPGRPKMTWKQLIERDCREWKLLAIDPHDRHAWKSDVRSAKHAASQLPGRGPTDVDVAPLPACLSNSYDDDDTYLSICWLFYFTPPSFYIKCLGIKLL